MSMRSLIILCGMMLVPAALTPGQIQPNSSAATLTVNGQGGGMVGLPQGTLADVQILGGPDKLVVLAAGNFNPGIASQFGFLNVWPVTGFLLNGLMDPLHKTDGSGQLWIQYQIPWLQLQGLQVTLQAAVEDPLSTAAFTFSAPTTTTITPTSVIPQHLFFDPTLSAKGVDSILPPAGTLPGDLPTLSRFGFPGPTDVFSGGLPVHNVFQNPFSCYSCHGSTQEIWPTYMGTMMANSSRDPMFKGQFSIAVAGMEYLKNQGVTDLGGELAADFCIRCHMPNAWQGGRSGFEGDGVTTAYTPGAFDHQHSLDQEGVLCDVCHRTTGFRENISPSWFATIGQPESSQLVLSPSLAKRGPFPGTVSTTFLGGTTAYGSHVPPEQSASEPPVAHNPPAQEGTAISPFHGTEYGPNITDSTLCGTCHNISAPVSGHAIERTYTEWLNSDFGPGGSDNQSCQECHMPAVSNTTACSIPGSHPTYGAFAKVRGQLREHEFVGGNAWIPQIFKQMYPNVDQVWSMGNNFSSTFYGGPPSRNTVWDATTANAIQKLRESAEVDLAASENVPGTIEAQVTVTNLTGHKLPTGYPEGRQMWVQVEALDANNTAFYQSGMMDANNVLIHDPDIKIYEAKHGLDYPSLGLSGPSFHFALNNIIYKDNRILPKGATQVRGFGGTDSYDPVLAPWPVGGLYPDGQHWDTTTYAIPVPQNTPRPIKVRATVFYQTSSYEYIDFLANGGDAVISTTPHPAAIMLRNMWNSGTPAPAVPVGVVGPMSTAEPGATHAGQTAMAIVN